MGQWEIQTAPERGQSSVPLRFVSVLGLIYHESITNDKIYRSFIWDSAVKQKEQPSETDTNDQDERSKKKLKT
jgi:hypothetical protein